MFGIGKVRVSLLIMLSIFCVTFSYAGEHPSKQTKGKHEHPEHPAKKGISKDVKMKDFAVALEKYIADDSALKGGYFMVFDKEAGKVLALKLDKVHKKRLSKVAKNSYFACADFTTQKGKVYDLDLFMKGDSKAALKVTAISVHKEAGKERYTWYEKKGIWHKKQVK